MINKRSRTFSRGANNRYEKNNRSRNDSFGEPARMEHPRHNESFEGNGHIDVKVVMGRPIIRPHAPTLPPRFRRQRAERAAEARELRPTTPAMYPPQPPVYNYPAPANYPHHERRNFSYPVNANDWNSVMAARFASPVHNYSYPPPPVRMYSPVPVLPSPVCPYTVPPPGMLVIPPSPEGEAMPTPQGFNEHIVHFSPEQLVPGLDRFGERQTERRANMSADETFYENMTKREVEIKDPMEFYLSLPKDVFPTANMIGLDPNPLIDELCKFNNLSNSLPWLLDLEFGMPREPTHRPIPIYDVKYNSIYCKNTPNAIHPGFEICSESFKRVLLFYYDCVVSSWYRGYVFMHLDNSVENFQAWLHRAMLNYGMCWP